MSPTEEFWEGSDELMHSEGFSNRFMDLED